MKRSSDTQVRRAAAQMHALAAVRREIRSRDSAASCQYLRDFSNAFRKYNRALTSREFDDRVSAASLVLIGDYHALPASQQFAGSLLRRVADTRPVVLGVETILSRDQRILDSWWRRETDEQQFRQKLRFDREWGYDWQPFYELMTGARDHSEGAYALDCPPRDDLRSIRSRDRHAAAKVVEMRQRHPHAVILVLFGESHMAPQHLPALLRELLPHERILTVLQNVDTLYWNAIAEQAAAVSVTDETVCVFNCSPLEKYESYRLCLEKWNASADDTATDFTSAVHNLICSLARSLGFRLDSPHNGIQPKFLADSLPEVISVNKDEDPFTAPELAAQFAGSGAVRRKLEEARSKFLSRLEEQGCVYVPAANRMFVREFRMRYVAAEAARFLYHACRGIHSGAPGCTAKLDGALAHFGSRLLCATADDAGGNSTGESLYRAYLEGQITKAAVRRIFLGRTHELPAD